MVPETQSELMPGQADRIQRRHNITGISYENAANRESCVSRLTMAKLTRSCAGQNPDAIKHAQFTTDIALKVNERYKRLALEYHRCNKNATFRGLQCRLSCQDIQQSGKAFEQRFP